LQGGCVIDGRNWCLTGLVIDRATRHDPVVDDPSGGFPMQLTIRTLFLLIAVILFVLAALSVDVKGISLVDVGLALFAGSFLVPDRTLTSR
jgi:hypothetical protein